MPLLFAALLSGTQLSGCSSSDTEEVIAAAPPLERVAVREGRIVVYPVKGSDWKDLVDLTIFEGFKPGMTFDDARKQVGPPDESKSNPWGPYLSYHRPLGRVVVAREEHRSGGDAFKTWRLYAYPKNDLLSAVFRPPVLNALEGHILEDTDLVIMSSEQERPALEAELKGGRVSEVLWYGSAGGGSQIADVEGVD